MKTHLDCQDVQPMASPYLEGTLPTGEREAIDDHIRGCDACRQTMHRSGDVQRLLAGALGPQVLGEEFVRDTSRRLRAIVEGDEEDDVPVHVAPSSFLDNLVRNFGVAPWWLISGAFHALIILLVTLITMAVLRSERDNTVIVTDLKKLEKPEEQKEPIKRDVFKKPEQIVEEEVTVEQTMVTHEEVEVAEVVETDDDSDAHDTFGEDGISDVWLGGSGTVAALGLGGGGGGRFGRPNGRGGRLRRAIRGGGGRATESAVDAALAWLARNQEPEGRWDSKKHGAVFKHDDPVDTGLTGLAILAFLGAGHTEKIGKYKDNVRRAVAWLIAQQKANGSVIADRDRQISMGYHHSIAGLALAEAAGMARVPATVTAAQRAVVYSESIHQNGKGSERMGWRYQPKQLGDISISGWFIMQLKSAKVAGLQVDPAAFDGAQRYLDTVQISKAKPGDPYSGHRYGYRKDRPGAPNGVRVKDLANNTAIGCLGRLFLGWKPEALLGGTHLLAQKENLPSWQKPHFYYWYYGTLCCFQAGGDVWKQWNTHMKKALVENQCRGGADDGSWPPVGEWVAKPHGGGRVMSTALGAMCLEVYYRYLPMYRE